MKRLVLMILMGSTMLGGCVMPGSIFNTEPFVDAKKDSNGNVTILDTPRMWDFFVVVTDMQISDEKAGERPPGVSDWNKHWIMRIHEMSDGSQENFDKYISYIIEQRRKEGLPDLIGYP